VDGAPSTQYPVSHPLGGLCHPRGPKKPQLCPFGLERPLTGYVCTAALSLGHARTANDAELSLGEKEGNGTLPIFKPSNSGNAKGSQC